MLGRSQSHKGWKGEGRAFKPWEQQVQRSWGENWVGFVLSGTETWWLEHSEYRWGGKLRPRHIWACAAWRRGFTICQSIHTWHFLCPATKHIHRFICIFSFDPYTKHVTWTLLSPYRWGKWPLDMLHRLPKITHVGSGETYSSDPTVHSLSHQALLLLRL